MVEKLFNGWLPENAGERLYIADFPTSILIFWTDRQLYYTLGEGKCFPLLTDNMNLAKTMVRQVLEGAVSDI